MDNPYIPAADKIKLLSTASGMDSDSSDPVMSDFFKLLKTNGRFEMARVIAIAYRQLYRQENNIFKVHVTSAFPLSADEEKRLKDAITALLNGGTMEYTSDVDPALIGGFVVKIDNELLDASISNEFKQLRIKLIS